MRGGREHGLVEQLAHDADTHAVEPGLGGVRFVRHRRHSADAEDRELVLRVVAGIRRENLGRVTHVAADRPDASVDAGLNHAVAADELLCRRDADGVVGTRRPADRRAGLLGDRARHEVRRHRRARACARVAGTALRVVRVAKRAAKGAARAAVRVFGEIRFREDDCPGRTQPRDEGGVIGRTVVGIEGISARRRAHVEGVVLVLEGQRHAVQRADELAGPRELGILLRGNLERIGHAGIVVVRIGHAARLAFVEAPFGARRRPQIQRRERVDLAGVRNRLHAGAENAVRLLDARAVVRLDTGEITLHDLDGGDLLREDRLLDLVDRCFLDAKVLALGRDHGSDSRRSGAFAAAGHDRNSGEQRGHNGQSSHVGLLDSGWRPERCRAALGLVPVVTLVVDEVLLRDHCVHALGAVDDLRDAVVDADAGERDRSE